MTTGTLQEQPRGGGAAASRERLHGRYRLQHRCLHHVSAHLSGGEAAFGNDPSAGSPTETLLRLLLPLDDQV